MSITYLKKRKKMPMDEYYTRMEDIEQELKFYQDKLKGKVIYCNCDTEKSNFVKYFKENKESLGIKEFTYSSSDFMATENLEQLYKSDVVITNPPFSKIRQFMQLLLEKKKDFIIIAPIFVFSYNAIFPYFLEKRFCVGNNIKGLSFLKPDGESLATISNTIWLTTFTDNVNRDRYIFRDKKSNKEQTHYEYKNYKGAFNFDRATYIRKDYKHIMGVPISFLKIFNDKDFELIGIKYGQDNKVLRYRNNRNEEIVPFCRVLIRNK